MSRSHAGAGLPRGRHRIPPAEARATQLDRILRAVVASVAELGPGGFTVSDIVRRARVSRATFYDHFPTKESCLLTATRRGGEIMFRRVMAASSVSTEDDSFEAPLAPALAAFFRFLTEEPDFAAAFFTGLPAMGSDGLFQLDEAVGDFATALRVRREELRLAGAPWPDIPDAVYSTLIMGVHGMVSSYVRSGRLDDVVSLERPLRDLFRVVLTDTSWSG